MRPMFAPLVPKTRITFVSKAGMDLDISGSYDLRSRVEAVRNCRNIGKKDMKFNEATPKMKVDPERYTVEADGKLCTAEPLSEVPLGQAYFVF